MSHLIRNFDFDESSLSMHEKLSPEADDLELGCRIENPEYSCEIIDLDGTRRKAVYPGVADIENCELS